MRVMLRKQLKRRLQEDKKSEFRVRGRPVKEDMMERFVKRKEMTEVDILAYDARK